MRPLADIMTWFALVEGTTANTREPCTCDNDKDEEGPRDHPFWLHGGEVLVLACHC